MKKVIMLLPILLTCMFLAACSNQNTGHTSSMEAGEATVAATMDTTGVPPGEAITPLNDIARKMVKSAALRCRVTDVLTATMHIEQQVVAAGGLIVRSDTRNEPSGMHRLPYGHDSLIQVQAYTTTSALTLKIPVNALDTMMNVIAGQAAFIDSRRINLDDVTLQYLSNQLKLEAAKQTDNNRPQQLARRTDDVVTGNEYTDRKAEASIERKIANNGLQEQVAYATLQVELYQPERVDRLFIPDTDELMKAPFGLRLRNSLTSGWRLLLDFVLLLINLWPLILASATGWLIFRSAKARKKLPRPVGSARL